MAIHLSRAVLRIDFIRRINNSNIVSSIEVGPGDVISRTVKWIGRNIEIVNISTKQRLFTLIEGYETS
jgi:hypothetical protein